jgi:hypothetical protein
MRYVVFLATMIVSLELLGASVAIAMPSNKAVVRASSINVIQVMQGCGKHYHRDKTNQCVPD